MKTSRQETLIHNSPEKVFAHMDSIANTGMHMTGSSVMMMGNKLNLEQFSENRTGLDSKFCWFVKVTVGGTIICKMVFEQYASGQQKKSRTS